MHSTCQLKNKKGAKKQKVAEFKENIGKIKIEAINPIKHCSISLMQQ